MLAVRVSLLLHAAAAHQVDAIVAPDKVDITSTVGNLARLPSHAPESLELPVLGGKEFKLRDVSGVPVVFNAFSNQSGFSTCLWKCTDSIDQLIVHATKHADGRAPVSHFVFLSHGADAASDVAELNTLISGRLKALVPSSARSQWEKQLHFVTAPVDEITFVSKVLREWPTAVNFAEVHTDQAPPWTIPRLDARYDWLGWSQNPSNALRGTRLLVSPCGDGCPGGQSRNLTGKLALVFNTTACDYFAQARTAQLANASGLVVVAAKGHAMRDMTCEGTECDDVQVGLPATMISDTAGQAILAAIERGTAVRMAFGTAEALGTDFLILPDRKLQQSWGGTGLGSGAIDGNPGDGASKLFPRMAFLAWAARSAVWQSKLAAQLEQPTAELVPVFHEKAIRYEGGDCYGATPTRCGPSAVVHVPQLMASQRWEVELSIGCDGSSDVACPQWDHAVQLRVCKIREPKGTCDAQAGPEIARWMTSFGRRIGHWVVDITAFAPLLASTDGSQEANVTLYSAPWAGNQGAIPWLATLNFRISEDESAQPGASVLQPWETASTESGGIAKVFRWVAFNQSYNRRFSPFRFEVPATAESVRLVAIISGHGNDNHGCGEFCATQHKFTINGGPSWLKRQMLPVTSEEIGCAEEVDTGVVPNEYGTWLYGRDGWCNGHPVSPWVVDISDEVLGGMLHNRSRPNISAILSYSAWWCTSSSECASPDPGAPSTWQQAAPVMMISVYVVIGLAPNSPWWKHPWAIGLAGGVGALTLLAGAVGVVRYRRRCRTQGMQTGAATRLLVDSGEALPLGGSEPTQS